ncbi:FAD-dependent monooxygenase [Actinoplanes bogorensis]|uniref:FAD-dependent monooxygenase n=1 Tax=Paractinoplanes bogorensis TaxID=1610840 RepID=A0ABS5Z0Q3_9ACTN|nr:FAD-dependent oxidoreductase [Actinoplanes bogorensis]MBU2669275.1 FAD-dependent monooxygenase [Actinoplanes bogorensis]
MEFECDVVICGGGPNGLMTACELALAGVRPVVIERRTEPGPEYRANGMVGQVVRLLERRGLYGRLADGGSPRPADRFMFAAFPLEFGRLEHNPVYTVLVPQQRIEAMLAERARELGVEIRSGHTLSGLVQNEDGVVAEIDGRHRLEAAYLVGADGGRSLTRKMAGIDFPGVTTDHMVSRAADVSVPDSLRDAESGGLRIPGYGVIPPFQHQRTERGLVVFAPYPGGGRTMINVSTTGRPGTAEPFGVDELRETLEYVVGAPVPIGPPAGDGPHKLRRLVGGNTRIADRYREGRVLLVGDAAHVHSAIGGPGLNLGLQDSVNLAWKLAATIQGWAPAGLLDTYERERRPVAERVTMQTQAQSVLTGPGPEVTALRVLFGELLAEPVVLQRVADLIAGADVRYDMGVDGPWVGRFSPDLGTVQRGARAVLVDRTGSLAAVAEPWKSRVDVVAEPVAGVTAMLVRPDGYVAWVAQDDEPDVETLRAALRRWFGDA